jgi:hypothetical protein
MAFDKQLANEILRLGREKFPDKIANLHHLKDLMGMEEGQADNGLLLALEALEAESLIEFQIPVRTGLDKPLRDFVNLSVTPKGRTTDIV